MALSKPQPDYTFQLLVCGEKGAGKSTLIETVLHAGQASGGALRCLQESYSAEMTSLLQSSIREPGTDCRAVLIEVGGNEVELQLWSSGIFKAHREATPNIFRNKHAILVVFDAKNAESWSEAKEWWEKVQHTKGDSCIVCIVENDTDEKIGRKVSRKEVIDYCKERDIAQFQTTAYKQSTTIHMIQALSKKLIKFVSDQLSHPSGVENSFCLEQWPLPTGDERCRC